MLGSTAGVNPSGTPSTSISALASSADTSSEPTTATALAFERTVRCSTIAKLCGATVNPGRSK